VKRCGVSEKALLEVDLKIATLRIKIADGEANVEIAQIELLELAEQRKKLVSEMNLPRTSAFDPGESDVD
jgi:hypothetical protein